MQRIQRIAFALVLAASIFAATTGMLMAAGQVLVSDVESCFVGVQGDRLIWSQLDDASIRTRLKSGGDIISLAKPMGTPISLTVYDGDIYWIEATDLVMQPSRIRLNKSSLDGTITTALSNRFTGRLRTLAYQNVVTHDGFIYWTPLENWASGLTRFPNIIEKISTTGDEAATLYSTQAPILSLARDNDNLYWIEQADTGFDHGTIRMMPLSGGAAGVVFAPTETDQSYIHGVMAAYQGQVVFADISQGRNRLMKSSASGGTPTVLAVLAPDKLGTEPGPTNRPLRIVIDGGDVYWIDDHSVNVIPFGGGTPQVLVDNLYYPQDLAVGGGYLYWSENADRYKNPGSIKRMPTTGGIVTTLTGSVDFARRLAVWDTDLYWAEDYSVRSCNRTDGQIAKVPQDGGPVTPVLGGISMRGIESRNMEFVTDSTAAYFPDGCSIKKVPLSGGAVERIVYFPSSEIQSIDADDEFVYSVDMEAVVRKTAKDGTGTSTLSSDHLKWNPSGFPLRVKGDTVYWGSESFQSGYGYIYIINRMPKTGGAVTVVARTGDIEDFAVDGDYLYILGGNVTSVPIKGGTLTLLAMAEPMSTYLTLGPDLVYSISPWGISGVPKAGGRRSFYQYAQGCGLASEGDTLYWTDTAARTIATTYAGLPPPLLSLASPAEAMVAGPDSLVSGRQPTFSWIATESFTGFTVLFSVSQTDFHSPVASASISGTKTAWTPSASTWKNIVKSSNNIGAIRNVYWKVTGKQKKKGASIVESEARSFKAGQVQAVTINSPATGAVLPGATAPVFDFATLSNIKFRLEVSSLSDFSKSGKVKTFTYSTQHPDVDVTLRESLSMANWKAVKKLIGTAPGYFRIRAWDAINRETVSETRSFTIQ